MAITSPTDITGCVLWLDGYETSTLFQDSAGTTAVTASGQPVGRIEDLSGNGNHATQSDNDKRLEYGGSGDLIHDGVADFLTIADDASYKVTQPHIFFYGRRDADAADEYQVLVAYPHAGTHTSPFFRWSIQYRPTNALQFAWNAAYDHDNYSDWSDDDHVYELFESAVYVDGVLIEPRPNQNITYPNAVGIYIGAHAEGGEVWDGSWKRIVIYDHALTSTEAADVREWIASVPSSGIEGAATVTLGALTSTATGELSITGATDATLGSVTLSSTGALSVVGTLSSTLGALTVTATGELAAVGTGSLSATLGALTVSATGQVDISGVTSVTLNTLTATATGALDIIGTSSATLGALTLSATGSLAAGPQGALSVTLGALTATATGALSIAGVTGVTLGALTVTSNGAVSLAGQAVITLGTLTLTGVGVSVLAVAAFGTVQGVGDTGAVVGVFSAGTVSGAKSTGVI